MFLKRLDLQGFKTFAARTEFVFDSGITAIVGPNGSGKSNIADAVRWVLGEQASRPLRIKRMEDVIFAGSTTRPRVGMAEVSITLDNATGWFPVEFSEVTITRRAYRSGETEYLINRSRVRLRDVVDMLLTANIGQNTYTVIGQGTVDAALSLRPEERRGLFEEAADIKRFQIKRNDAVLRLQETEANLVRVRDIVAEIEPRLTALQAQARRAQERDRLAQDLRAYLAAWYVHRWGEASESLRRSLAAEADAEQRLAAGEAALREITDELAAVRQREVDLRGELGGWHRQASALHTQAEALQRRIAVQQATLDANNRQRLEILTEIMPLQEQAEAQQQALIEAEAELAALSEEHAARLASLADLERDAAQQDARRKEAQTRLTAAEAAIISLAASIAAAESSLAALQARQQGAEGEIAQRQAQVRQYQDAAARAEQEAAKTQERLGSLDREIASHSSQQPALQSAIAVARRQREEALAALNAARDERRALETRHESLLRLQESVAGYDAGVRSVLSAARAAAVPGIIGTVASILRVPPQYEAAIGAALGGHEQDIVVESWQAAEEAVAYLRRTQSGRATFLPLDVIKEGEHHQKIEGAIGWAAELVQAEARYRGLVGYLLGRVLVVRDLSTARQMLAGGDHRSGVVLATVTGDLVRPGGAITGGSPQVRTSGLLERERELAELPARVAAAREAEQTCNQKLAAAEEALRRAEQDLLTLDGRLAALRHTYQEQAAALAEKQRERERWQRELSWVRDQEASLAKTLSELRRQEGALRAHLERQKQEQATAQAQCASLRGELTVMEADQAAARLAEARTAAALAEQDLKARHTLLDNRRQEWHRLRGQIAAREKRSEELAAEAAASNADIDAARLEMSDLSATISVLQGHITPAEDAIAALEKQRTALMEREVQARGRHLALERAHSQAAIEVQRARDELGKLQAQIEAEEGLGLKEYGLAEEEVKSLLEELAVPVQLGLGIDNGRQAPPSQAVISSPEGLRRRVDSLRAQLRHLGPVNPNAVTEYEQALSRYTFLTSQAEDLEHAIKSLKAAIAELDAVMRRRFEETFEAVALQFRAYFQTLFNGGTAKLVLTDPDDMVETGVEIVAQPPGRRLQSLALLSGGERALTATALLFAILTVNPTPFCILDEVDAALDDVNVGRFCDALRQLAERTQFIIITHNRGTMEIASALYGVSMAADGTSQVLSLKLEEARAT